MLRRYRLLAPDNGSNPTGGEPQAGDPAANPQPQAGVTSTEPQAGDSQTESISLEEAKKLRSEAANLRKRMKAYEDADAAAKAAQLTEQEKLQQAHDALAAANEDLAAELLEYRVNQDISKLASKFNFIITSPELIAQMLTWKEIEWDEENGKPLNIEKLLEELAKAEPNLVKQEPQQQRPPALPANNPGRTTYGQPGTVPGRIPRLDDIPWKR